jgi:hypothetical protein
VVPGLAFSTGSQTIDFKTAPITYRHVDGRFSRSFQFIMGVTGTSRPGSDMADGGGVLSTMSASYAMARRCNSLLSETAQTRAQRVGSEALLPLPWGQFRDTSSGMLPDALQDVDQVGVDVNAVEPASHDEALHYAHMFGTQFGPTEIPIFTLTEAFP